MTETTLKYIEKLEKLLAEGFFAKGEGLSDKIASVEGELPDELREMLLALAQGVGEGDTFDFAFRCGQSYERLESLVQSRLAAQYAFLQPDGTPPPDLENLDAVARVIQWRDNILKTVADYTLKFLLVSVILLALGVALGLI